LSSLHLNKLNDVIEEEISSNSRSSDDDQMKHFREDEFIFNQKTISDMNESIQNHKPNSVRKSREKN